MDRMLIPFVVASSASAFVVWRLIKEGEDSKGSMAGAAIAAFVVSISITHTIVFIPFIETLKLLSGGLLPAGMIGGAAYFFGDGKRGDRFGFGLGLFLAIMFLWLVVIGFVAGDRGDYSNCHDSGPQGMSTVCE